MAHDHKVLNALDAAKTQWYHFAAVVVAGIGFFTDAYDLFSISLVTELLGRIYYFDPSSKTPRQLPSQRLRRRERSRRCGTLAGQLFFGWLGDKMGRKKVYGMTLMLMAICCLASGLSFGSTPKGVMATLCFFRFWLGFGIGVDYPLSGTIMSEYANKRTRGAFIAAVFAMQGFGNLTGGIVAIIISAVFKARFGAPAYRDDPAGSTMPQADYAWRIVLNFRCHPGAAHLLLAHEDARDDALHRARRQEGNLGHGTSAQRRALRGAGARGRARATGAVRPLLPAVLQAPRPAPARHDGVLVHARRRLLLAEPVPERHLRRHELVAQGGYHERPRGDVQDLARADARRAVRHRPGLLGHRLLHRHHRVLRHPARRLLPHDGVHARPRHPIPPLDHAGFIVMYAFTFFSNFGPNSTTFIVRAEIFPARLRSTCHGISSAAGKAGAIVGSFGFLYAAQSPNPTKTNARYPPSIGVHNSLFVLAGCNVVGFLLTFLVPESRGKSLEELSGKKDDEEAAGLDK